MPVRLAVALVTCLALLGGCVAAHASGAESPSCTETDLPVTGPDGPATMHGQLCLPAGGPPAAVQLLVHGGTYNRYYWDLPYDPDRYSYQRDMAAHGYATFAVDLLGTGRSTRPPAARLLIGAEAASLHDVVGHLRAGRAGGVRFGKVVIAGHSVGSGIVAFEAARYHDVDGVILTGITHVPSVPALTTGAGTGLEPAFLDRRFEGADPAYFVTKPGARAGLFYAKNDSDPRVIAADEATKDEVSAPGMATVAVFGIVMPATSGITVPVFQAVGGSDVLFCGVLALRDCSTAASLREQEAPYYSAAANLTTYVLPGAGHSLALHENAGAYRDATRAWLTACFGL
ncbi:alpha/beta hydrolase [Amycolatopsis pigmentata]|uniref:Alpha/beta hydrolase n=1 Tax=Amycolatopsis pigmentata TaxID=450801 RepID=A0ABW5FQN4_9PSEU